MLRSNASTPGPAEDTKEIESGEMTGLTTSTYCRPSQVLDYANPDQEQIDLNQATMTDSRGDLDGVFERKGTSPFSASNDLGGKELTTTTTTITNTTTNTTTNNNNNTTTATSKTKSFQNVQKLHNSPPSRQTITRPSPGTIADKIKRGIHSEPFFRSTYPRFPIFQTFEVVD